ncbi:MAG: DUF4115 domain-containing protein [Anaerolineaceae bacterium]|nr:DUF4115 domain-containing protein [Anaerolineaceae bacterium]
MVQSIGKTLKEERLRQGISIQEVSKQTLIRINQIEAIEDDDFTKISSDAQLRGFINIYCEFLNLGPNLSDIDSDISNSKNEILTLDRPYIETLISNDSDNQTQIPDNGQDIALDQSGAESLSENKDPYESESSIERTKSQEIFEELGDQLRQRRDMLSFSLSNVEDYTHVKEEYLEALESGNHSALPSPVQTRGMITNYSRFLNLDENILLLMFAEGLQEKRLENSNKKPQKTIINSPVSATTLSIRKFFTLDLFFGSILILGILAFLIWGASNMLSSRQRDDNLPTIPDIADVLISTELSPGGLTETPGLNETIVDVTDPEPTSILVLTPLVNNLPIQITIISRQSSWIRIIIDGKLIFEGRIEAGNAFTYSAVTKLELVSGNASALQVFFKEEDLGTLGLLGQVVTLLFDKSGLIKPTATPSPTATNTPPITITPTLEFIN